MRQSNTPVDACKYVPGMSPSPLPDSATLLDIKQHPIADPDFFRDLVTRNAITSEIKIAQTFSGFMPFLHPDEVPRRKKPDFFLGDARYIGARHVRLVRTIPRDALNRALAARIAAYKEISNRPPTEAQRNIFAFEESAKLMPDAPFREHSELVIIDVIRRMGIVEAANAQSAHRVVDRFTRYIDDDLPLFRPEGSIVRMLTDWTQGESYLPEGFTLGTKASMLGGNKERASVANHRLEARTVQTHLHSGMNVQKLELLWPPNLAIVVEQTGSFAAIRYLKSPIRKKALTALTREDLEKAFQEVVPTLFDALERYQTAAEALPPVEQPAGEQPTTQDIDESEGAYA